MVVRNRLCDAHCLNRPLAAPIRGDVWFTVGVADSKPNQRSTSFSGANFSNFPEGKGLKEVQFAPFCSLGVKVAPSGNLHIYPEVVAVGGHCELSGAAINPCVEKLLRRGWQ